jgi:hypothetical protein
VDKLHEVEVEPSFVLWHWLRESEVFSSFGEAEDKILLLVFHSVNRDRFSHLQISDGLTVEVVHRRDALKGHVVHDKVNQSHLTSQEKDVNCLANERCEKLELSDQECGHSVLARYLVRIFLQVFQSSEGISNITIVAQVEEVAAQQSQGEAASCWLDILKPICVGEGSIQDEKDNEHLDEEDHCSFEEVVLNVILQLILLLHSLNHARESETVNTELHRNLLFSNFVINTAITASFHFGRTVCCFVNLRRR